MKINLISVGRVKSDPAAPMVSDYVSRIQKFIPFDDTVLKVETDERIAQKMLRSAEKSQLLVAMDERGTLYDSHGFSKLITSWMNAGHRQVSLVIGGADGLPRQVKEQADMMIGLSKMTLPHRLARLILVEQIYRALCIYKNVPYQK